MFAFVTRRTPGWAVAAIVACVALGGCASTGQNPNYVQASVAPPAPIPTPERTSEPEDDGLPAQAPPPSRIRALPDDPSEPFSRNYGSAKAAELMTTDPSAGPPQTTGARNAEKSRGDAG